MKSLFVRLSICLVVTLLMISCGPSKGQIATPAATATPTSVPNLMPTAATTATSVPSAMPGMRTSLLPGGYAVRLDNTTIQFYSPNGSSTGSLATASALSYFGPQSLHVTGGTSTGIPPVVYISGASIFQNTGGQETVLASLSGMDFFSMVGAESSPYFAYTTASQLTGGVHTQLYVGTPSTIGTATPVVDITDPQFKALRLLALNMAGGIPVGAWYTSYQLAIEMGNFDPCNRLVYLDLNTGASSELLGNDYYFPELSPDHNWVAYTHGTASLNIRNLVTGTTYTFPVVQGNTGQPGDGVFSPDDTHVAWMEASGELMGDNPTFQTILRVGTTNGQLVADFPAQDFNTTAGFPVIRARPVAWIDNDSLLIQGGDNSHNVLLRLDLPGTQTLLTSGMFIGLTYP